MSNYKIYSNGVLRDMNDEEKAMRDKDTAKTKTQAQKKLEYIKETRNHKLQQTDFYALSDVTMTDDISTYRQALRDIPQDYSEDKYDELLATDDDGNLTHTVWSKP
mgnify:CR=1 FL=1|tara:strand:- start:66 stop:383 length:318 start_codon:yes stop_codon:yes gene_type:complete